VSIKVLVISYYFPPVNHIAAQRAEAFQKYFPSHGIEPIIATRHWSAGDRSWYDYFAGNRSEFRVEEQQEGTVLRIPFRGSPAYHRARSLGRPVHQAYILANTIFGNPQPEIEIFRDFYPVLRRYLEEEPVDLIVATFQPASVLKLGDALSRDTGIPWVADFRDVWNPAAFGSSDSANNRRQAFLNRYQERHFAKWLRSASLVSAVNQPIIDRISSFVPVKRSVVVTNGFEEELFDKVRGREANKFTISIVGTLYAEHDLSVMLDGLNGFLKDKSPDEVELKFVGAGAISETEEILRSSLPAPFLNISGRIPHEDAVRELKSAHVLYYVGWKGYKGMTPGKIFDYLGAKRNVLIAPSDRDTMEKIVTETGAGVTADTVDEFVSVLENWFREWRSTGEVSYGGDDENIAFYTRENQTAILARELRNLIAKGSADER